MDSLAQDLASGKIKIVEAEKKPEKPAVVPEKSRLALLMKKHDDQSRIMNRTAQEALSLQKHHKSLGEHELAGIHKEIALSASEMASLHKKLHGVYSKRHGEGSKK